LEKALVNEGGGAINGDNNDIEGQQQQIVKAEEWGR